MMSELLAKVAEILGAPETLVQRSAEARAEASGILLKRFYNHGLVEKRLPHRLRQLRLLLLKRLL